MSAAQTEEFLTTLFQAAMFAMAHVGLSPDARVTILFTTPNGGALLAGSLPIDECIDHMQRLQKMATAVDTTLNEALKKAAQHG